VVVENPIAVVDRNADRHHVRDVAAAFITFLHESEAQQAFAEFGFRPTNSGVATSTAAAFAHPPHLFTIASLGGWDRVYAALFSPHGAWTRAVEGRDK
ncbi:MAG TPA: sulfate ABC transporter substrate-binding protein, partial [Nitrospira sp.]|nr:sulfate ABC transporter substrate-binding protein [Nitrospira sp.]